MGVAKLTDQNTIVPESKYARIERERRYLLQDLPEGITRADYHLQITDNYISGTRLRLRRVRDPQTNKWVVKFTQKFAPNPNDLSRTTITNTYLNATEAETLAIFEANEIRKNRYHFEFEGRQFSVDMFLGDLFGLVLAEVSFRNDEELENSSPPPFVVADVTNNELFTGGRLSQLSFADLRDELVRMGLMLTFTFVILLALGGCRKQTANQSQANTNAAPSPEAPTGGTAPTGEKLFFRGDIAGNLSIEMVLLKDGDRVTGTYMYPKIGKDIALTGTIDKDGNVTLTESDETGKQTGIFKGKWRSAFDSPDPNIKEIEGKWSKPDGSKETEFMVSQQPIEFTAAVKVVPKVIKEANKEKRYTVDAEYPQIEGDARFDGFNREARNLISKDVAAFKSAETEPEGDEPTEPPAETQNSSLDAGYDFRYATDELISLEWAEGTYEAGAAHGNHLTQVLNYDVKKGKKLTLADLFIDKSKYLTAIANYCMKELKDRSKKADSMIFEDQIESGAGPRADNYRAWSITKKGLWITFDPYQVAAYAAGPQYVLVPYSALKDIIRPDGPIANFAK